MADTSFRIDQLATNGATVTVADDGTGSDWLILQGSYADPSNITLGWSYDTGHATAAAGTYWLRDGDALIGSRLIVTGAIENVKGADSADFIQGNELDNILYGDQTASGIGGADTLYGGDGRDTVYGGEGADLLGGEGGNDLLYGNAGTDTINGGAGIDTIEGGRGADVLAGGADAGDTVSYLGSAAGVQVDITYGSATTGRGGAAAGDTIQGFDAVWGSAFADVIRDTVKGEIAFGYNANRFEGRGGDDMLQLGGGNDTGLGGIGNDTLLGEQGNDLLRGGDGDDLLRGGAGADVLTGGPGADRFDFDLVGDSAPGPRDRITDFSHVQGDVIDLRTIDTDAVTAGDQAFHFSRGGIGALWVEATTGGVLVKGDVTGDGVAELVIFVAGVSGLVRGDFLL